MGKKRDLSVAEKREIEQSLEKGMKTLDISRKLKRDHRTVKKFVCDSERKRVRSDKGILRKVSVRKMNRIKRAAAKHPLMSSKQVFEAAGATGVPRTSRCRILQRLEAVHKTACRPPLPDAPKEKKLQTDLFTHECHATLDDPASVPTKTRQTHN